MKFFWLAVDVLPEELILRLAPLDVFVPKCFWIVVGKTCHSDRNLYRQWNTPWLWKDCSLDVLIEMNRLTESRNNALGFAGSIPSFTVAAAGRLQFFGLVVVRIQDECS